MIRCQRMEVLLSCYLDGELPQEQAEKVAQHLCECSSCSQEYRTLKKNQLVLSSLQRKEVPETIWPAIQQRIRQEKVVPLRRSWPVRLIGRLALAAAAVAVVLFFGIAAVGYADYCNSQPPAMATAPPQQVVTFRNFMEGHAKFLTDDDPLSDKAAWNFVQSHHAIERAVEEGAASTP